MAPHGHGGPRVKYGAPFFHWLNDKLLMIEDYAYAGTTSMVIWTWLFRREISGGGL